MIGCWLQVVISDCATQGDASENGPGGTSAHTCTNENLLSGSAQLTPFFNLDQNQINTLLVQVSLDQLTSALLRHPALFFPLYVRERNRPESWLTAGPDPQNQVATIRSWFWSGSWFWCWIRVLWLRGGTGGAAAAGGAPGEGGIGAEGKV